MLTANVLGAGQEGGKSFKATSQILIGYEGSQAVNLEVRVSKTHWLVHTLSETQRLLSSSPWPAQTELSLLRAEPFRSWNLAE